MTEFEDDSNNFLFMITTHGKKGKLDSKFIEEGIKFITKKCVDNTKNIFIGFDGDGANGHEWPMPSTTAVTLVYELLQMGYRVGLVQSQVFSYAEPPAKYSQVCSANLIETEGTEETAGNNKKKIKVEFYDPNEENEANVAPKPQVYSHESTTKFVSSTQATSIESYKPWKIVEEVEIDNRQKVPFYTIAYNVPNDDEKRKQKPYTYYDSVDVPYGVDGKMGNKLTVLQNDGPSGTSGTKSFFKEILVRGPNGKYVDLYGGSASVNGGVNLVGVGDFAGSTKAWVGSKFMNHIPQNQRYLLCFWDEDNVGNDDNTYDLSISRRISDMLMRKQLIAESVLFKNNKGGDKVINIENRDSSPNSPGRIRRFWGRGVGGKSKKKKKNRRLERKRSRNLRKINQ